MNRTCTRAQLIWIVIATAVVGGLVAWPIPGLGVGVGIAVGAGAGVAITESLPARRRDRRSPAGRHRR